MREQKPSRVRWIILALLSAFSLVSYLERVNISIAAELMMPDLGIDKIHLGRIFSSFLLGYAIFQVPAGWLGDRFGPRLILGGAALVWGLSTVLTGLASSTWISGGSVVLFLLVIRFALGAGEAATYPVAASAVRSWVPPSQRALGNSLMLGGMPVASAIAPPLVSWLMLQFGWRQSFYVTSAAAFLTAIIWLWFSRDHPQDHPAINAAELSIIAAEAAAGPAAEPKTSGGWKIFADRRVLLLSLSYVCEGYVLFIFVFWLYIYLVDVHNFGMLRGGLIASLPWITGIFFMPLGGFLSDRLSVRSGRLGGARWVIMFGYGLCGVLLFVATLSTNRTFSVAVLCLSVGCLLAAESSFWSSAVHLAGESVGVVCGVMNTTGILGGILSTSLVPILVKYYGWLVALGSGAAVAVMCVTIWWRLGQMGFGRRRQSIE